jgi:hypothetical protein
MFLTDDESRYYWDNYPAIVSLGQLPIEAVERLETHARTLYKVMEMFRARSGEKLRSSDFEAENISIDSAMKIFMLLSARMPSAIEYYHNIDDPSESFIVCSMPTMGANI